MSLINQMLKDLASRRSQATPAAPLTEGLTVVSPVRKLPVRLILLVLILLVLIGVLAVVLFEKKEPAVVPKALSVSPRPVTSVVATSDLDRPTLDQGPVILKSVTILDQSTQTQLTIDATQKLMYQVISDINLPDILILSITAAPHNLALPVPAPTSLVESLKLEEGDARQHLVIHLKPGVKVVQVGLASSSNHQLTVLLTPPPTTAAMGAKQAIPLSPKEHAQEAYQAALAHNQAGQVGVAIEDLKLIVKRFPDYLDARIALITLQLQQGQVDSALALVDQSLVNWPASPNLWMLKARALAQDNQPLVALGLLQSNMPDMIKYPDYYALEAALLRQQGQYAQAQQLYSSLLTLSESQGEWWLGLALCADAQGNRTLAMNAYRHVLQSTNITPEVAQFVTNRLSILGG